MNAAALATRAAHITCSGSGCSVPNAMFSAIVASNMWFSCSTKPIWRRNWRRSRLVSSRLS